MTLVNSHSQWHSQKIVYVCVCMGGGVGVREGAGVSAISCEDMQKQYIFSL